MQELIDAGYSNATTTEGGIKAWKAAGYPVEEAKTNVGLPASEYLPEIPRIGVDEVKVKLDDGANILIIDSRSKEDYDESHIVGAISIPLDDMGEPYEDLGEYDEIFTYCT